MPRVQMDVPNKFLQSDAIARLQQSCERLGYMAHLQHHWQENNLVFSAKVQGVACSGVAAVFDYHIEVSLKLPVIALPFKSWIPTIVRNALKQGRILYPNLGKSYPGKVLYYLHIPKAAGTTMGEYIYNQVHDVSLGTNQLMRNGVYYYADGFFRESVATNKQALAAGFSATPLRAVIGHFSFGIHEVLNCPFTYVTVVRHPVQRALSLYQFLKLQQQIELDEFVRSDSFCEIENDQTLRICGKNLKSDVCTEADWQQAKTNLDRYFAVVGCSERFNETLALLSLTFGWTNPQPSYPRNISEKTAALLTPELEAIILARNQFDLKLHQYANELMNAKILTYGEEFAKTLAKQEQLNAEVFKKENTSSV